MRYLRIYVCVLVEWGRECCDVMQTQHHYFGSLCITSLKARFSFLLHLYNARSNEVVRAKA